MNGVKRCTGPEKLAPEDYAPKRFRSNGAAAALFTSNEAPKKPLEGAFFESGSGSLGHNEQRAIDPVDLQAPRTTANFTVLHHQAADVRLEADCHLLAAVGALDVG